MRHLLFDIHDARGGDGGSPRNLFKCSETSACVQTVPDSGKLEYIQAPLPVIFPQPTLQCMSNMTIQGAAVGAEAGKLQADLRNVFSRLLSHARTIDMTMTLGDSTEALGQIRELEAYLERGLEVLSKPLTYES